MEAERNEILAIINTTHDVQLVKQLLLQHPTLCEWPQFRLSQQQQHCCIIRLLIEAGLRSVGLRDGDSIQLNTTLTLSHRKMSLIDRYKINIQTILEAVPDGWVV